MSTKLKLIQEVIFKTSRSGGKGGQNVNKVSSKVEIIFDIQNSLLFTSDQKLLLLEKLANRLDSEGLVHVVSQENRSQLLNKQRAVVKLHALLSNALAVPKKRKPTVVPASVVRKRLINKAVHGQKKANRSRPNPFKED